MLAAQQDDVRLIYRTKNGHDAPVESSYGLYCNRRTTTKSSPREACGWSS